MHKRLETYKTHQNDSKLEALIREEKDLRAKDVSYKLMLLIHF